MRENGGLNFYRNLMKHEVTVDRNKTAPRCRNCCYFRPDFKYRRCLFATCPYLQHFWHPRQQPELRYQLLWKWIGGKESSTSWKNAKICKQA